MSKNSLSSFTCFSKAWVSYSWFNVLSFGVLYSSRLVWFLATTLISWSLLWNQRLLPFTAGSSASTKWLIWAPKQPWTVTAQRRTLGGEWPRVSYPYSLLPYYRCNTSFLLGGWTKSHSYCYSYAQVYAIALKCLLWIMLSMCFDVTNLASD